MDFTKVLDRAVLDLKVSWELLKEIDVIVRPVAVKVYEKATSPEAVKVYRKIGVEAWGALKMSGRVAYECGVACRAFSKRLQTVRLEDGAEGFLRDFAEMAELAKEDSIGTLCIEDAERIVEVPGVIENGDRAVFAEESEAVMGCDLPRHVSKVRKIFAASFGTEYRETAGLKVRDMKAAIEGQGRVSGAILPVV